MSEGDKKPKGKAGRTAREVGKELVPGAGATGAAIGGTVLLGPPGALIGPVAAIALKRLIARIDKAFQDVADDFAERRLGPMEHERLVRAHNRAIERLVERLHEGEGLRNDGFFDDVQGERRRTPAEEALEGVMSKARDAYEDRKAERLGELFAFIAVSPDITPAHGNYLIELATRLTYLQLLLLGLFGQDDRSGLPDWTTTGTFTRRDMGLIVAIEDLGRQELIVRDDNRAVATFSDVNPRQLRTVLNGRLLHDAMQLNAAEPEDWEEVLDAIRRLGTMDSKAGTTRIDSVVPRGSAPDATRVEIGLRVVDMPDRVLRLSEDDAEG